MSNSGLKFYLGIDVGSVSTKIAVIDSSANLVSSCYLPTAGNPLRALKKGLGHIRSAHPAGFEIDGCAVTGSGRHLAAERVSADIVKNEITCQAASAVHFCPGVQTVIEIGGQDSKLIIIRNGLVVDFGMNSVCAAGTGSFLDHQANRLGINLEEMGSLALTSCSPVPVNATCTVFAESDMITLQQSGSRAADIIYGVCMALASNFQRSVIQAKPVTNPVVFQGGVAHNKGMQRAFREKLGLDMLIPPNPELTGAAGAALLCLNFPPHLTRFAGFSIILAD